MKKFSFFGLLFTLFIMVLVTLFIAVPQALSRSPDTSPGLILNMATFSSIDQSMATFQAIEYNLFNYTDLFEHQTLKRISPRLVYCPIIQPFGIIEYTVKHQESNVRVKDPGLAVVTIIRPILLL